MQSPRSATPAKARFQDAASQHEAALAEVLSVVIDAEWYLDRYTDIAVADLEPVRHFIRFGLQEGRDPNPFFDSTWYLKHYPDVSASGMKPLLHYMMFGARELRNPHPHFDAIYYAAEHPEAAANPLLFHLSVGRARGYATARPFRIDEYLPSQAPPLACPAQVVADVIIPVYRGLAETRRCLGSVLADRAPPLGRVIVVEDRSPEADLVAWLQQLAAEGHITLLRNRRNLGFVASVNRGMVAAGAHDVVLLNSDTEVPRGWLARLAAQAHAAPRIASVSPFSNNATICGYPDDQGGAPAFGHDLAQLDDTCRTVNAGRSVEVPTTVGFCMYIRRDALNEVGLFDAERFGHGYGEENDFCLRASARGWRHRLACDTFVFHAGQVSFGSRKDALARRAMTLILERFPDYEARVAGHVRRGLSTPARFAVTAALLRQSQAPVILMVTHNLGGGIRHHINRLVERYRTTARILLLEGTPRGTLLSVPELAGHPVLPIPLGNAAELEALLRSANVGRVHIHHLLGIDVDLRRVIQRLGVPFDTTVHDYYGICPQINMLPWRFGHYCEEPDIGGCNSCIARSRHWARDIVTWRAETAWMFQDADRVLCPSQDVVDRLRRYGLARAALLTPHEPVQARRWPMRLSPPSRRGKLRIAVLGTLAPHKGSHTVAGVAQLMDPRRFELHLIGSIDGDFPAAAEKAMRVSGPYEDADLPDLIERAAPHVIWFPMAWPETYSYTLSAAIEAGTAIAAPRLGSFPERLSGRPATWLLQAAAEPAAWLKLFEAIGSALQTPAVIPPARRRVADFYAHGYLLPTGQLYGQQGRQHSIAPVRGRRRFRVAIVPERFDSGQPTPCAYIRLIQPLFHPAVARDVDMVLHDCESVLDDTVDVIVTQRFAPPDQARAETLMAHARKTGARLIYDLDDDLLHVPRSHPDARTLRPRARMARSLLLAADAVWVSTAALADRISPLRRDMQVIENRIDERIWAAHPVVPQPWNGPVRVLCMGTTSHTQDFHLIEPALQRLKATYGGRVSIDVLGMTNEAPPELNRISGPPHASRSYPGFVEWLTACRPSWQIGLAPLIDSPFSRCKSSIKALDYAAMGLTVLASDTPVYRGSIADGPAGRLVANDEGAWFAALDHLVRDRDARVAQGQRNRDAYLRHGTLAQLGPLRRQALMRCLATAAAEPAA